MQLNKAFNKLNLDRINIYRDVDVDTKICLLNVSYKLGKIQKQLKTFKKVYIDSCLRFDHVCVLFVKHSLVENCS